MKITNVKVYDLKESLIASGYPMSTTIKDLDDQELTEKDISRGIKLTKAADKTNNAHEQFMTGIRVNFDLTCSNKMWVEAERYRFLEFISSQSTMHRISKFNLREQYNEYVDPRIIDIMEEKIKEYNKLVSEYKKMNTNVSKSLLIDFNELIKKKYLEMLYSNPAGFQLTARMTTNYRCLKNIYKQRKDHRLPEWREFCKWIETLPYFEELIKEKS